MVVALAVALVVMDELHSKSSKRHRRQISYKLTKLLDSKVIFERGGCGITSNESGTGENVSGRRLVLVAVEKVRNSCHQNANSNSNPCVNSWDQSVDTKAWACANRVKERPENPPRHCARLARLVAGKCISAVWT
jgi:hypothetical protein